MTFLLAILLFRPNLLITATKLNPYAFLSFVVLVLAGTEFIFFTVACKDYRFFQCAGSSSGNTGMFSFLLSSAYTEA